MKKLDIPARFLLLQIRDVHACMISSAYPMLFWRTVGLERVLLYAIGLTTFATFKESKVILILLGNYKYLQLLTNCFLHGVHLPQSSKNSLGWHYGWLSNIRSADISRMCSAGVVSPMLSLPRALTTVGIVPAGIMLNENCTVKPFHAFFDCADDPSFDLSQQRLLNNVFKRRYIRTASKRLEILYQTTTPI